MFLRLSKREIDLRERARSRQIEAGGKYYDR
jgi:hypothetical protein